MLPPRLHCVATCNPDALPEQTTPVLSGGGRGQCLPLAPSNNRRTNVRFAGPTATITPWNFPFMMITRKVATALPAGCTMIIKPSEQTPLTAYKLLEYARKAGIPEGVFEMVTGNPKEIGKLFTGDTRIRKLPFTGSTAVGKLLASTSGKDLKRMTLELGGNAPFIVFDDSDFETAVAGAVAAKLRNSGQVCISPNRLYVQSGVFDRFVAAVTDRVAEIRVDQGLQEEFVVGPMASKAGYDKVVELVKDATAAPKLSSSTPATVARAATMALRSTSRSNTS
jgi:succinate-semialdehyde dehydrogenase / glutarate-semialdehyde dehydrogenase